MDMAQLQQDRAEALKIMDVSRETLDDLDLYVATLLKWQKSKNLIAPDTLPRLWTRHVADSWQLVPHLGKAGAIVDMGSGAGFPGMVLALANKGEPQFRLQLVESRAGKAAFLREVARVTRAPVEVICERAEALAPGSAGLADYVTARALAPLAQLLAYSFPLLKTTGKGLFLKGQDVCQELTEAQKYWTFRHQLWPSLTDRNGSIVEVSEVAPRV